MPIRRAAQPPYGCLTEEQTVKFMVQYDEVTYCSPGINLATRSDRQLPYLLSVWMVVPEPVKGELF